MARSSSSLGGLTWPEVDALDPRPVLVVPMGSTEQHGPHLPLDTDTRIAVAVAGRVADDRADVLVAPALTYGSSGEHAGFAGTLSIGHEALELVLVELVRSADAFAGVVLASGHGGNAVSTGRAVETLTSEGRRVAAWFPRVPGGDAHAGRTETSIMLAVDPGVVRPGRAAPGVTTDLAELMPELRRGGLAAVSPTGVLGDPTGADADEGRRLLDALVADLHRVVDELVRR